MKKVHTIKTTPNATNLNMTNPPDKVDRAAIKTQTLPVHGQGRQSSLSKSRSSRTKSELQFGFKKKKMLAQPSERHVKVTFISFFCYLSLSATPPHTSFHFHFRVSGGNNLQEHGRLKWQIQWDSRSHSARFLEMSRLVLKWRNFQR